MHFVHRRNGVSETRHNLHRNFEAQIHTLRADVKQQVAPRGNRTTLACANLPERVQFRRPRRPKEPVPRVGPEAHDAGEARFQVAKLHCSQQRREFCAERPQGRSMVETRVYGRDQEDRGACERRVHRLRNGPRAASHFRHTHRFGLHLRVILAGRRGISLVEGPRRACEGYRQAYHPLTADIRPSSTCRTDRAAPRSRMGRQVA